MEARRVFIVGASLFAETLAQALAKVETIKVIGCAPTVETAAQMIRDNLPDVVIIAEAGEQPPTAYAQFLAMYPDLRIIRADLNANNAQVITCRHIGASMPELLAAIEALLKRS
ncbi:MAG: response regulator transcription factor [Chloroflexi bacterium]|nr:response regulator transcription factor [Chloroflexota bacterium]